MKNFKKFCILGERNSGTNFLCSAILNNFDLSLSEPCNKHFWRKETNFPKNVIIIGIVRNIFHWVNSMYHSPYHLQPDLKKPKNKFDFLNNSFYSIYDIKEEHKNYGKEILDDRHIYTNLKYKNIFEARYTKYGFLLPMLTCSNKNFYFIKYENLNENYEDEINKISNHFEINLLNKKIKQVDTYRGFPKSEKMINVKRKPIIFSEQEIKSHPDYNNEKEIKFGYYS